MSRSPQSQIIVPQPVYGLPRGSRWASLGVDAVPMAPGSLDDEFNGSSLDTGRWTWLNQASTVATVAGGILTLSRATGDGGHHHIVQPMPSGVWEVTTKVRLNAVGNYFGGGLGVSDGNSWHSFTLIWINGFGWDSGGMASIGGSGDNVYLAGPGSIGPWANVWRWLRLRDNGTNFIFSTSEDGIHFTQRASISRTSYINPTLVGLFITLEGTNGSMDVDYFRRTL